MFRMCKNLRIKHIKQTDFRPTDRRTADRQPTTDGLTYRRTDIVTYRIVPYYRPRRSQKFFANKLSKYYSIKRPPFIYIQFVILW